MINSSVDWDKFAIAAEVKRRGKTLTSLALENGLSQSSCRSALIIPVPSANKAIALFIGVSVHDLWPDWYREDGTRILGSGSRPSRTKSQVQQDAA